MAAPSRGWRPGLQVGRPRGGNLPRGLRRLRGHPWSVAPDERRHGRAQGAATAGAGRGDGRPRLLAPLVGGRPAGDAGGLSGDTGHRELLRLVVPRLPPGVGRRRDGGEGRDRTASRWSASTPTRPRTQRPRVCSPPPERPTPSGSIARATIATRYLVSALPVSYFLNAQRPGRGGRPRPADGVVVAALGGPPGGTTMSGPRGDRGRQPQACPVSDGNERDDAGPGHARSPTARRPRGGARARGTGDPRQLRLLGARRRPGAQPRGSGGRAPVLLGGPEPDQHHHDDHAGPTSGSSGARGARTGVRPSR